MKFFVYSSTNAKTIESGLGGVDYSYYFVLKSYLPLLQQFGDVEVLSEPLEMSGGGNAACTTQQYYFSFTPPNRVCLTSGLPVIPVFAWEFGTLPDKPFVSESDDWKYVLGQAGRAITHSQFAAKTVRKALGEDFPVVSIPAPIWDRYEEVRAYRQHTRRAPFELPIGATVIDSNDFEVVGQELMARKLSQGNESFRVGKIWDGTEFTIDFSDIKSSPPYSGFTLAAGGELWNSSEGPWFVLPFSFNQPLTLEIELKSADSDAPTLLQVHMGTCSVLVEISHLESRHQLQFDAPQGSNLVHFSYPEQRAPFAVSTFCVLSITIRSQFATSDLTRDERIQWHGVNEIEGWGRWTRNENCGLVLPFSVAGKIRIRFIIKSSMMQPGDTFKVRLGSQISTIELVSVPQVVTIDFDNVDPTDTLGFHDIKGVTQEASKDKRRLGLGLSDLICESLSFPMTPTELLPLRKSLYQRILRKFTSVPSGKITATAVVYTTVFNPIDGRKNWPDIIKAFVFALRDKPAAILVVKITHSELQPFLADLCSYLVSLAPFKCRIFFLHGYIADDEYERLIKATSFIVNASKGEGQCLPLMEFMSSGVPAIAPNNTAMADYVNEDNAFVVKSGLEPAVWPQDPSLLFRTTQYRINWESLYSAFTDSFALANSTSSHSVTRYREMSDSAIESLQHYCSSRVASERLSVFLDSITPGKSR